tara:strand:- start:1039 stop:1233 length:195 start_codon:yes stop_codon:yes gene_type:complete
MTNETQELAIYVLRWLDRNNLGDTDLREIMDCVGNYNYSLMDAVKKYKVNTVWEEQAAYEEEMD